MRYFPGGTFGSAADVCAQRLPTPLAPEAGGLEAGGLEAGGLPVGL